MLLPPGISVLLLRLISSRIVVTIALQAGRIVMQLSENPQV